MTIPVARRVQRVKPSPTLAVTARAAQLKAQGKDVIEYGRVIGVTSQAAARGAHVHTHNLKTKRWKA